MQPNPIKTRFAPSPTGELHLGNLRTALFNALLASHLGGQFLLRIEDTDQTRSRADFSAALQHDLRWLGLDWQEGPGVGGAAGPYQQSERAALYNQYFSQLEAGDHAYPCFCSQQALSVARKVQQAAGRPPRYPGTCARLSPAEREARLAQGIQPTLRFRVPEGRLIEFDDLVRGAQQFRSDDIGDFVIRRGDGSAAFFFCNALDDALMGISHVLRGEDHLANTPRQILILEALGLTAPRYGHISLIVGADGSPLSKRHGSTGIRALREIGILPLALLNHLARLGHTFESDAFMSREQLAEAFDSGRLGKAPARHDPAQLLHWQKEAVAQASDHQLWDWLAQHASASLLRQRVPTGEEMAFIATIRANMTLPQDALAWAGHLYAPAECFDKEAQALIRNAGTGFFQAAQRLAPANPDAFKEFVKALGSATGQKGKALFLPLRAALSGQTWDDTEVSQWQHGPELARIWALLGPVRGSARLAAAAALCETPISV